MKQIFVRADLFSEAVFTLFSICMFALMLSVLRKANAGKKVIIGYVVYTLLFCLIVGLGLIEKHFLPLGPLLFFSVFAGSVFIAFSNTGLKISEKNSLKFLIGVQAFRLPLELILHKWSETNTIPSTMTWTGQNWDIITGIVSLAATPLLEKSKKLAWLIQIIGFVLLINVLRVVILSSPLPFSWPLDNPLQLVMYLPYALIGPLFVGTALIFHLIVFRKLMAN